MMPATAVVSGQELVRTQGEKLKQLMAWFNLEMDALGMRFAMVSMDEKMQAPDETTLGWAGNMSVEAADQLFELYLMFRKSPNARTTYRAFVKMPSEMMQ